MIGLYSFNGGEAFGLPPSFSREKNNGLLKRGA